MLTGEMIVMAILAIMGATILLFILAEIGLILDAGFWNYE